MNSFKDDFPDEICGKKAHIAYPEAAMIGFGMIAAAIGTQWYKNKKEIDTVFYISHQP